jgi:predicted nucleic acid-binding protein
LSGFLLDTNVVSEPQRPRPDVGVLEWLAATDEATLHLSVVSIGELRSGIASARDSIKQARLEAFFAALVRRFSGRIHPFDQPIAERWGALNGVLSLRGIKLPGIDSLIAATALHHDFTVVTRNEADFRAAGVPVLNPFS